MTIRLVLADDHRMFREAVAIQLEGEADFEVVGEAQNGRETLDAACALVPDVLVLDIALPDANGIDITRQLKTRLPNIHIIALSGYSDSLYVDEMLKAGAEGYILKSAGTEELIKAIRTVSEGTCYLSSELMNRMVRSLSRATKISDPPSSILAPREKEVLRLLAAGKRSSEIAAELGIVPGTVDVHRRNIREKLGLYTTAELTRYAIRHGLSVS